MLEFFRKNNEVSGASDYINRLISEGRAHLVPERLIGKTVGWSGFYVETNEFSGYEVKNRDVNLDREIGSARGRYEIIQIGPVNRINFEKKVGTSESSQFMIIQCQDGKHMKMGFIVKSGGT